jgi:hypothetical protein
MSDLFLLTDDRFLLGKWDYAFSLLDIVARDYSHVLRGERFARRHRTILIQTVSDLIEIEADLVRMGATPPSARLTGQSLELWRAASEFVTDLRRWRVPQEGAHSASVEAADRSRRILEEQLNDVILELAPPTSATEVDELALPVVVGSVVG